jgi:hypothetical protein
MQDLSPEYAEIMVIGKVLQASGYFRDVRDQAQAVTKILFGRELGFSPIVSMGGIHIIEGKPALSSNLMATLIKRSGKYDYRVKEWTDGGCVLTFREKNESGKFEDVGESSFTIEDGRRAGVVKPGGSWAKYPKAMTFARALSQGLRTYCPDVSAAPIYNPEEMGATVDEEGAVVELPKSARRVEVTTEDIEIGGTAIQPAGSDDGSKGTRTLAPQAAEIPYSHTDTGPPPTKPDTNVSGYIESGQAANLHKTFRDALMPANRKASEELLHDWLKAQGIVDADGKPTALAILKANYFEVREQAVTHAASL